MTGLAGLTTSTTQGNQWQEEDLGRTGKAGSTRRSRFLHSSSALATVLLSTAASTSLLLPTSSALAACTPSGGSNWTCSGSTNTTTQNITQSNATVTTAPGFSVDNPDPTYGSAIRITGAGTVSYIDANGSKLTAQNSGFGIEMGSSGDISGKAGGVVLDANGDITANGGTAVSVANGSSGQISVKLSGAISGRDTGIFVRDDRGSGMTVTTSGIVTSANGNAITLANFGTGASLLNATGDLKAGAAGVFAENDSRSTDLTVNVNNVSGGYTAIQAFNRGTGNTQVNATGKLVADGSGSKGIIASNESFGSKVDSKNLTINAVDIEAGLGIWAMNGGVGDTTITTTGTVTATESDGIWAVAGQNKYGGADGAKGTLAVSVNNVTAVGNGVYASNAGEGDANVTATGTVSGGQYGIATTTQAGSSTIKVNNVTGTSGSAITAAAIGGDIKITTAGLVQGGQSAITMSVDQGKTATAILNGTTRNLSGVSTALAISSGPQGSADITNNGLLTGVVHLGGGPNTLTNTETWNTAGGTNAFGGNPASAVNNKGLVVAGAAGASGPVTTTFQGLGTFTNSGTLAMGNGVVGDQTVIYGEYRGNGGTVTLDTVLGSDGSPSDMLVINGGKATGTTQLDINNVGGTGALTQANGIKLVDAINGATTDAGAFSLAHAVSVGAYDYGLYRSGLAPTEADQNWYLRSTGQLNPGSQTALPYADVLSQFAQATLGTLQQRTGNRVWPTGAREVAADLSAADVMRYAAGGPTVYGQGAWGRLGGQYASYDPKSGSAYSQSIGFMQAGYEGVALEAASGELAVGAYATIGTSKADIHVSNDPVTGARRDKGKITTTAYGMAANLTWLGKQGFYADMIGQFTWYDSDLSNKAGGNNSGWSSALSLEMGRRFEMGSGWALVPQAQLAWTHVDFNSFLDNTNARVALGDGDSLMGRAGVRVENRVSWRNEASGDSHLQVYGIANLTYQFLNGTSVDVAGTSLTQNNKRLWGEVGLGANHAWNDKWSLYGEVNYASALSSGAGDNYTVKGTAGARYRW